MITLFQIDFIRHFNAEIKLRIMDYNYKFLIIGMIQIKKSIFILNFLDDRDFSNFMRGLNKGFTVIVIDIFIAIIYQIWVVKYFHKIKQTYSD